MTSCKLFWMTECYFMSVFYLNKLRTFDSPLKDDDFTCNHMDIYRSSMVWKKDVFITIYLSWHHLTLYPIPIVPWWRLLSRSSDGLIRLTK